MLAWSFARRTLQSDDVSKVGPSRSADLGRQSYLLEICRSNQREPRCCRLE